MWESPGLVHPGYREIDIGVVIAAFVLYLALLRLSHDSYDLADMLTRSMVIVKIDLLLQLLCALRNINA